MKKILWTELLFSYFPIDKQVFWQQMLARFGFLFALWLSGLLVHALDGLTVVYVLDMNIYLSIFGTFFLILFGSYYLQRMLNKTIQNLRPMLKLDNLQFQKFSEQLERTLYGYSFLPCLFMAIGFAVLVDAPNQMQQAFAEGWQMHVVWNFSVSVFGWLLGATVIWMFLVIWLSIFFISRQPLNVKLSPEMIMRFRELNMFAFWFSLFYFIGVSIGMIPFLVDAQISSFLELVVSPYLFFIAIGIVGILFPFYNIHVALLKMKKQELSKIAEEYESLLHQLDDVFAKRSTTQLDDQTIAVISQTTAITARLFSLQVKERHVISAQEWPIDISFFSKLVTLALIPIISRIIAMLIFS